MFTFLQQQQKVSTAAAIFIYHLRAMPILLISTRGKPFITKKSSMRLLRFTSNCNTQQILIQIILTQRARQQQQQQHINLFFYYYFFVKILKILSACIRQNIIKQSRNQPTQRFLLINCFEEVR